MGSKAGAKEGKVIILLLLVLALGAVFFALKKDREAKASKELADVHRTAATDARADGLKLKKKVKALELARKKAEDIAKAFDAAPRILPESPEVAATGVINPGEVFEGEKTMLLVDPERIAEAAASLVVGGEGDTLLALCRTARDDWKKRRDQQELRALKWKGRFPLGILGGAVVVGAVWIISDPPWKK